MTPPAGAWLGATGPGVLRITPASPDVFAEALELRAGRAVRDVLAARDRGDPEAEAAAMAMASRAWAATTRAPAR